MFKLLKNGKCYDPEYIGKKDVLLVFDKICKIEDDIPENITWDVEVHDCSGKIICPGLLDLHVHITGGGGEQGPASRIPELMLSDITAAGVTTVVGVLGVDGVTRNISGLLSKALALQYEGLTTYIYTGSYGVPTDTLTGKPVSDLALIEKVIGIGEIAIADYRSSYPSAQMLKELASEAIIGGMLGNKAGIMHIHVGDGRDGLKPMLNVIEECDFTLGMFLPTHINRNMALLGQGTDFARKGGYIDLTAGESSSSGCSVPDSLELLLRSGISIDNITVTSDGNGSAPGKNGGSPGIGKVSALFDDLRCCILERSIKPETALKAVTVNPSKRLKLFPRKGTLRVGADADLIVLDEEDYTLEKCIAMGNLLVDGGKPVKRGMYDFGAK